MLIAHWPGKLFNTRWDFYLVVMFTFEINFVSFVPREERDYYEHYRVNNTTLRKQTCLSLLY